MSSGIPSFLRGTTAGVLSLLTLLFIVSCDRGGESGQINISGDKADMAFTAPARFLQSRMIVRENLILEITIDDREFTVPPDAEGNYVLRTSVTPNSTSLVSITWSERIGDEILILATASDLVLRTGSASSPAELRIFDSQFNTDSHDLDDDGTSNLQEREGGSDYDNDDDPVARPIIVTLNFRFFLPEQLENAPSLVRSQVSAQALVNDEEVLLTRDGDEWTGTALVTENSDPLITANFFATPEQTLQLATFSRSDNVGSGASVDFADDVYDVDSFDKDSDGFSNAREIAEGTDPGVPNMPPVADAGPDQTIQAGDILAVDGSGSSDSDGNLTRYRWVENSITLADGIMINISGLSQGVHLIDLVVTDNNGATDTDQLRVTVTAAPNVAPTADAGPNQSVVEGMSVLLDGQGSTDVDGTLRSYEWSTGNTALGSGPTLSVADLTPGVYPIDLVVTDDDNATGTDRMQLTITAAPVPNVAPTADAGPNRTVEEGQSVLLDGQGSDDTDGTVSSYEWSTGTTDLGSGATLSVNLPPGVYLIDLLVTDDDGATDTDQMQLTITAAPVPNVAPTADAGPNRTVEEGQSVLLDGQGSDDTDGTVSSYEWSTGTTDLGSGATLSVNLPPGVYLIDLLVTDDDGATDTDQMQLTITAAPVPNVAPTADAGPNRTVEEGQSVLLDGQGSDDTDGTVSSYEWSTGTTDLGSGATLSVNLPPDVYLIDLLVTDDDGATDTDQMQLTITAAPVPNVAPTADAGPNRTVEEGQSVLLDGQGSDDTDGTVSSYEWSTGTTDLGSGATLSVNLPPDVYLIDLLVTDDDGATDTDQMQLTVTAAPVPNMAPMANAGASVVDSLLFHEP